MHCVCFCLQNASVLCSFARFRLFALLPAAYCLFFTGGLLSDPLTQIPGNPGLSENVVRLSPQWDFYWKQFLIEEGSPMGQNQPVVSKTVSGMKPWNRYGYSPEGYASYRTLLPLEKGKTYGFRMTQLFTSAEVYFEGRLVARAGAPAKSEEAGIPSRANLIFYVTAQSDLSELVIQVSNYHDFRGGLRGNLQVAGEEELKRYVARKLTGEALGFGILLALGLYHCVLFLLQKDQKVYIYFAVLCLSFAFRIPLMGEKAAMLVFGDLPWQFVYRLNTGINIVAPPFILLYLSSLIHELPGRRIIQACTYTGIGSVLILFFPADLIGRFMFAYYLLIAGPVLIYAAIIAVIHTLRYNDSTRTMGAGMVLVCVFGLTAIYLTWTAREGAADVAILAFVSFGVFQAIGVAQRHRDSIQKERDLSYRLIQSKEDLSYQRKTLESDLHDNLGSRLTDLKIRAERNSVNPAESAELMQEIDELQKQFREQLLFIEDLDYATENPVSGLQLALLRRYSNAAREIRFVIPQKDTGTVTDILLNDSFRLDVFQLAREVCTNDLKYGYGESVWRIRTAHNSLKIFQLNPADRPSPDEPAHIRMRAKKLSGRICTRSGKSYHAVTIEIPLEGVKSGEAPRV